MLVNSTWNLDLRLQPRLRFSLTLVYYNKKITLDQSLSSLYAATMSGGHKLAGSQQPPALLVVVLVHADQKADALGACSHPQRVRDENPLQGLQKSSAQVVAPEGLEVVQLRELDVAHNGAQISGAQQRAGSTEQLELSLQRLPLVRGDAVTQRRLVLQVLRPDTKADIWERRGGGNSSGGEGLRWRETEEDGEKREGGKKDGRVWGVVKSKERRGKETLEIKLKMQLCLNATVSSSCCFLKGHSSHSVQVVQELFRILFLNQTQKRKQLLKHGSRAEQTEFRRGHLDRTVSVHFCFKEKPLRLFGWKLIWQVGAIKDKYSSDAAVRFLFLLGHNSMNLSFICQLLTKRLGQKKLEHENFQHDDF